ncbi:MAG TPA: hypothetical protein VE779_09770 [Candidatus Angelobacter sp.]|nr:hypothetical protein [Candidatus Angelobacter sp.]
MRNFIGLLLLTLASSCLWAQLPSGTLLPVMLDKGIDSSKAKPGDEIVAKLQQDVPLSDGVKIKRLAKVTGHIVAVSPASDGEPASLTVQFDHVEIEKDSATISTGLRTLASIAMVNQVRQPVTTGMASMTARSARWDLNPSLIGGQVTYPSQKLVKTRSGQVVGKTPEPGAVLGVPIANPDHGCAGPTSHAEQAFWVFSTDACGVYDIKNLTYVSGIGEDNPGKIVLSSPKTVEIRAGSGWLLQVN